ncbi:hypothetical protein MITS9504_00849 [Synechococcus sp. MIT S9504]|nr:hypothetical protein MITS9504_00849 [Synechococcus sp. MIT S9504]
MLSAATQLDFLPTILPSDRLFSGCLEAGQKQPESAKDLKLKSITKLDGHIAHKGLNQHSCFFY